MFLKPTAEDEETELLLEEPTLEERDPELARIASIVKIGIASVAMGAIHFFVLFFVDNRDASWLEALGLAYWTIVLVWALVQLGSVAGNASISASRRKWMVRLLSGCIVISALMCWGVTYVASSVRLGLRNISGSELREARVTCGEKEWVFRGIEDRTRIFRVLHGAQECRMELHWSGGEEGFDDFQGSTVLIDHVRKGHGEMIFRRILPTHNYF